jgi:hypothetical protein
VSKFKRDLAGYADAYWALQHQEPINRLVDYLRDLDHPRDPILVFLAECLDPSGDSEWTLVMKKRGRGRSRRPIRDVATYRGAAARALKRIEENGNYEAELAQACDETGLRRSEMAVWMSRLAQSGAK